MLRTTKRLPAHFRAPSPPLRRLRYIFRSMLRVCQDCESRPNTDRMPTVCPAAPWRARAHWHSDLFRSNPFGGAKPAQPLAHPGLRGRRWHGHGRASQSGLRRSGRARSRSRWHSSEPRRAALLTVRREAASSRSRALTSEVCSGSAAARVRRPKSRRVPAREGTTKFRNRAGPLTGAPRVGARLL